MPALPYTVGQLDLVAGFQEQLALYGRTLTDQDGSGITFQALMTSEPPVDPRLDLGSDLREVTFAYCLRPTPAIAEQDELVDDSMVIWKVVKLIDNPAQITVVFTLVRVAPEDT